MRDAVVIWCVIDVEETLIDVEEMDVVTIDEASYKVSASWELDISSSSSSQLSIVRIPPEVANASARTPYPPRFDWMSWYLRPPRSRVEYSRYQTWHRSADNPEVNS